MITFDADAYTQIDSQRQRKRRYVKAMGVIKPEYLEKMLTNLPPDFVEGCYNSN